MVRPVGVALAVGVSLLAGAAPAFALDPRKAVTQYRRDTWTQAHGLPHSSINRISQDREGYLWLSTFGGAVRFDGVRFETVALSDRSLEPLGEAVADTIEGRDGARWVATGRGLLRVEGASTTLITRKDGLPANGVLVLDLDDDGRVLAGTGQGLAVVDSRPPFAVTPVPEFAGSELTTFHHDRKGRLWVGTRQGLLRRDRDGRWSRVNDLGLGSLHVWSVTEDASGGIWIATRLAGLISWTEGQTRRYTRRDGLAHDVVRALATDRDGSLWIGTSGGGLNRLRNGRFETLTAGDGALPSDVVRAILEDREGNLWIGTAGGGLTRLSDLAFTNLTTREGLPDDSVWTVMEDRRGSLWVGSNAGLAEIRDGDVVRYAGTLGPPPIVLSLLSTRTGRLLVGTYQGLYELRARKLIRLDGPGDLTNSVIRSIVETRDGAIWLGTEAGLAEYRPGSTPAFETPKDGPGAIIAVVREARQGGLWIGLERGGLLRYDKMGGFVRQAAADSLGPIRDVVEDERGVLWVGGMGLGRVEQGRVARFGAAEGFAERRIHALLFDGHGGLWMSTNTGIYRALTRDLDAFASARGEAIPAPLRFEAFRESEGAPAAEGNGGSQPAAWRASDGRLWFATIRGLAGIDPVVAARPEPKAVARVREAHIDRGRVERGEILPVGARRIEFEYTALSLTAPQQIRFRYRLEPVDVEWSDAGSRRSVAYASLAPGSYRFRVAAAGRDGDFLEDPAPFVFVVTPYWYERPVVRFGIFGLALLSTVGLLALRVRGLRRRGAELERIVAEKTRDLERLALEDPLTGLANRRHFDRELDREVQRARRSGQPIALLMVDVDFFKAYNDALGHPQGDQCLRLVAAELQTSGRRAGDLAARVGGEEFALLLPDMTPPLAEALAERLRQAVFDRNEPHPGAPLGSLTLSIGVAAFDQGALETLSPSRLVETADAALYEAKAAGRNRVVLRR